MKNNLFKKGLVVGIILLFIGISVIPSNANFLNFNDSIKDELSLIPLSRRNTIYVDDDNTEGPWDGTIEHPYQYIQDGVDNAVEGDTIYVFNGLYNEHIVIDKSSIKLIGEDKDITIIDGNNKGLVIFLDIHSNYNQICNFTIRNGSNGIKCLSNYNKIYNNIIKENNDGIVITDTGDIPNKNIQGSYNKIYRNIIEQNSEYGITNYHILIYKGYIYRDSYNRYYENIISYNYKGIDISNCNHCNVYRNYIHNNRGGGIIIWGALNIITNNDIRNSSRGILLDTSYLGKIEKNNFINNTQNAFFIQSHRFGFSNQWKRNYWDDWGGIGPELISGRLVITDPDNPYDPPKYRDLRNYDWFPARKPYKITFTNNIEGCGIE